VAAARSASVAADATTSTAGATTPISFGQKKLRFDLVMDTLVVATLLRCRLVREFAERD
jgi:hypothetical protein